MKKDTFLILIFFLIFNSLVPLFAQSSGMKDDWYSKSIAYEGDWSLIKKTFDKIEEKKQLTIGVIGGSITAGAAASDFGKTSWGPLVTQWFRREFPDTDISFYNAGIGATNSIFGAHRVDDDLLKHKPDLVIVEFSVNDMHTSGTKMSYESLIRKILNSEQKPAVLTLGLMVQTGENWQNMHLDVSRNYRVPYISYRDAIYPEVEKDNLTWRELSPDDVHPSDKGHQIIANLITHFLKKVCDSRNSLPEPITSNRYEHSYVYHFCQ